MNDTTRARLTLASLAYLIISVIHDLDHVRQGRPLALEVTVVGIVAMVASVACLVLAMRGHPFAPLASLITGAGSVVGLILVHLVPRWSAFSDSYPEAGVDALAYGIVVAQMASAAYLALEGYRSLREISAAD